MQSDHTAKAFDEDLQELNRLIAEMGGLAERQIADSVDALVRRDTTLATNVIASDLDLDKLQQYAQKAHQPLEQFIRTSITDPNAYTEPGYHKNVMPPFASLPKTQLDALVQYLTQSSKKG